MRNDAAAVVCTQPITHQFLTTPVTAFTAGVKWIGKDSMKRQVLQNSCLPCFLQLSASQEEVFTATAIICIKLSHQGDPPAPGLLYRHHQDFSGGLSSPPCQTERSTTFNRTVSHFPARHSTHDMGQKPQEYFRHLMSTQVPKSF